MAASLEKGPRAQKSGVRLGWCGSVGGGGGDGGGGGGSGARGFHPMGPCVWCVCVRVWCVLHAATYFFSGPTSRPPGRNCKAGSAGCQSSSNPATRFNPPSRAPGSPASGTFWPFWPAQSASSTD